MVKQFFPAARVRGSRFSRTGCFCLFAAVPIRLERVWCHCFCASHCRSVNETAYRRGSGNQFLYDYDYRGLIKYCDEVIASNPNMPDVYFFRAIARYNLNIEDVDLTTADLNKALELDPQHVSSLVYLGIIASDYGNFEDAIVHYTTALEIDPTNSVALNFRTKLHDLIGDLDGLEADFTQYISIEATQTYGYLNQGLVRAERTSRS